MSKNINQVFMANPITTNQGTDLMYFGRSPYNATNDTAMLWSNFAAQFTLATLGTHDAILTTNATGVITPIAVTDGQLAIGSSTGAPLAATLTAGTGITITNGHNSITIATAGSSGWVDQTTTPVTMTANTGYTSDDGVTPVVFTLPLTSAIGDFVEINGKGSGGYTISQAAGQQIHYGNQTTTLGATGTLSSSNQFDCVRLRCLTANTIWTVVSSVGNLTTA
jgi:uncharacterized protein YraI